MAVSDTLIDTLFDGRYRIVRKLGSGGMANVYLAEDQELGRRVAIKILNEKHAGDEQFVERFRREAKNAAALSHPNIVSIYDRGQAEGTYYIAMEYLDGRTLKELIVGRGPAPAGVAIDYARQILAALRVAHRSGLVHRDIKPHNALVDGEGRLKVTDFGIARAGPSQMTEAGSIIGTAQYLSPEQAQGAPVSEASDLYSVGVVLYELLTGKVPFTGETPVEIAMKHLAKTPDPPSRLRPDVPRDLDLIVMRALAKDQADRYSTADEMDSDLARVQRGLAVSPETEETATAIIAHPVSAPTLVTPRGAARPYQTGVLYDFEDAAARRRSLWPWLLALLLLALAGVAGWFAYEQIQHQLNANKPIAVKSYVGLREPQARDQIASAGLTPHIVRQPSSQQPETFVFKQDPAPGSHEDKGNTVTIFVSTGKAKTIVPDVRGKTAVDAAAALAAAHLQPNPHEVPSDKPVGTVLAQDPLPNAKVPQGTKVRINISKGPQQVVVPAVVGEPYDQAASELQAKGFAVARNDVDSNEAAGTVVSMSPAANTLQPQGSTVTLSVSKGPTQTQVPDVTTIDQDTATSTLKSSGFNVKVVQQPTTDPTQDGIVLSQDPPGGSKAKPGSTVTITVGKLSGGGGGDGGGGGGGNTPPPPPATP